MPPSFFVPGVRMEELFTGRKGKKEENVLSVVWQPGVPFVGVIITSDAVPITPFGCL